MLELYTYAWFFLNHKEEFSQEFPSIKLDYHEAKGQEDEPCITFNIRGIERLLFRNCKNGKFEVENESPSIEFETIEEVIDHIN